MPPGRPPCFVTRPAQVLCRDSVPTATSLPSCHYPLYSSPCTPPPRPSSSMRAAPHPCCQHREDEAFARALLLERSEAAVAAQCFTETDEGRTGRGRAGGYSETSTGPGVRMARGSMVPATAFSSKVLETGFQPALTSSVSEALRDDRPPSAGTRLQPVTGPRKVAVHDTDLRTNRYQALPPIRLQQSRAQSKLKRPPAFPLYLGVTATTLTLERYRELHPDQASSAFVDGSMAAAAESYTPTPDADAREPWSRDNGEAEAVIGILSELLQDVVADESFIQAAAKSDGCPRPFFRQLRVTAGDPGTLSEVAPMRPPMPATGMCRMLCLLAVRPRTDPGFFRNRRLTPTPSSVFRAFVSRRGDRDWEGRERGDALCRGDS